MTCCKKHLSVFPIQAPHPTRLLEILLPQRLLNLQYPLPCLAPLLPLAVRQASLNRESTPLHRTVARHALNRLLDAHNTVLANVLFSRTHDILQLLDPLEILIGHRARFGELHEGAHGLGADGCEAVDYAGGVEEDDGAELLAEARVDAELGVVDLRV